MSKREYHLIAAVLLAAVAALPQASGLGLAAGGLSGFFAVWHAYMAGSLK